MCIRDSNDSVEGKTIVVTGSGNVAIYAVEKATQLGAKVVAMNDSNGYVYDPNGINLDVVKDIKEVKRGRIKEYADRVEGATYTEGLGIWNIKCDIYLPCATQNLSLIHIFRIEVGATFSTADRKACKRVFKGLLKTKEFQDTLIYRRMES